MIKNAPLVGLSSGTIGEDFAKHEVAIGLKRLEQFGLKVKIMPHALKGIEYVKIIRKIGQYSYPNLIQNNQPERKRTAGEEWKPAA